MVTRCMYIYIYMIIYTYNLHLHGEPTEHQIQIWICFTLGETSPIWGSLYCFYWIAYWTVWICLDSKFPICEFRPKWCDQVRNFIASVWLVLHWINLQHHIDIQNTVYIIVDIYTSISIHTSFSSVTERSTCQCC